MKLLLLLACLFLIGSFIAALKFAPVDVTVISTEKLKLERETLKESAPGKNFYLDNLDWQSYGSNRVLLPPNPQEANGVVHFIGGFFFGEFPQFFYGETLETLRNEKNLIVVASRLDFVEFRHAHSRSGKPFLSRPASHEKITRRIKKSFNTCYRDMKKKLGRDNLPIYRLAHSMGSKISMLLDCDDDGVVPELSVFMAANNYDAAESLVPYHSLVKNFKLTSDIDQWVNDSVPISYVWKPNKEEFYKLARSKYKVDQNLFIRFTNDGEIVDSLDCSDDIIEKSEISADILDHKGEHLTPLDMKNTVTTFKKALATQFP